MTTKGVAREGRPRSRPLKCSREPIDRARKEAVMIEKTGRGLVFKAVWAAVGICRVAVLLVASAVAAPE